MAHIFFERLERRRSTQALFTTIGGNTGIRPLYGVEIPGSPGWGNIGYSPDVPRLLYGIGPPFTPPTDGSSQWGGLFGMSGYFPYSRWTSPFDQSTQWKSFPVIWDSSSLFSPLQNVFQRIFGSWPSPWPWQPTRPSVPDFRILYGVFPEPTPPSDIIVYYGIGIIRPIDIISHPISFYGVGITGY